MSKLGCVSEGLLVQVNSAADESFEGVLMNGGAVAGGGSAGRWRFNESAYLTKPLVSAVDSLRRILLVAQTVLLFGSSTCAETQLEDIPCSGQADSVPSLHHSLLVNMERPVIARIDDLPMDISRSMDILPVIGTYTCCPRLLMYLF